MRILGIVLLSLLGLILLIILLLLFAPITYRIRGSCHDKKLHLNGRVFALAGIVGAVADYSEELQLYLRFLGLIKLRLNGKDKEATGIKPEAKIEPETETEIKSEPAPEPEIRPEIKPDIKQKRESIADKIRGFISKIKSIPDKIRALKGKAHCIIKEIKNERNKKAVQFLIGKVLYLLKHLSPKRSRLELTFSTGSPDTTGELLGVLAVFPIIYQKNWKIRPDFGAEEFFVETDFVLCGHIYGITILITAIQVLLDRNCQRLYKKIS